VTLFITLNHGVLIASLLLYVVLGTSFFWILFAHLYYRRRSLAREAAFLAAPLPAELPHVLMQLPTFNEGALVLRLADAVARLDWPKDRLHVQILDDSTDDSLKYSHAAAASLCAAGYDAAVLHRTNRAGFKAGAMAEGLAHSDAEFVAILDADYLPLPDFLALCMRPFLRDANLALVQARCDYLNGGENLVTGVQRRILDAHYAIEQSARAWSGQVMPFNGTCGIWRRKAIDAAGGWQGDTIAEDMDVSYRVQMAGWHALFLSSVTVPGELPCSFRGWRLQQFRWTKGSAEVTRKLLLSVWGSGLSVTQKIGATFHLGVGAFGSLLLVVLVTAVLEFLFAGALSRSAALLIGVAVAEMIIGPALLQIVGQVLTRRAHFLAELVQVPMTLSLQLAVGLANLRGGVEAFAGHGTAFVRTAKEGSNPANLATNPEVKSP
jgi:cellulose synthase/poly-beta-1,6-N-acetylglucosamine synthase-like glycosyltransferase